MPADYYITQRAHTPWASGLSTNYRTYKFLIGIQFGSSNSKDSGSFWDA